MRNVSLVVSINVDVVVRDLDARMLDRDKSLVDIHGKEHNLNQLLFTDDIALVDDSEERVKQLVEEYKRVHKHIN